jgi:glycine cleavage system H protein
MNTYYTKDHEWIKVDSTQATIGVTDHAQSELGDVVFVDLPEIGRVLVAGEAAAVIESVKAASDVYSPIDGEVVAVNELLEDNPALVNESAEDNGWLFQLKLGDQTFDGLMNFDEYTAYLSNSS